MRIGQKGLDLIKKWEGLRLDAYADTGGVPTIGYGHTDEVSLGQKITAKQAEDFLKEDVIEAEAAINQNVKVELTQNQFDALVSFVYNIGNHAFYHSTMLKQINLNMMDLAATWFKRWVYDNHKLQDGKDGRGNLVNRRKEEEELFREEETV